jgi:hypothetical protein
VRTRTVFTFVCSAAAVVAALAVAAPASVVSASGPLTPACGWRGFSVATANEDLLDSAAEYWLLPFTVQDGLRITLDGRYPDSRYASLQAYSSAGALFAVNGVSSALTDYQIQPDPGSVNPWQYSPGRHPRRDGNAFTITLQSDVAPGQANVLPLAPAGTAPGAVGYLQYRVYLPAGGDFSRVPVPVVTFTLGGVSQQVPVCPPGTAGTASGTAAAAPASGTAAAAPATGAAAQAPEFVRVSSSGGFPNADSAYLVAAVTPPANGDVLVIRGKAPAAPTGSRPSPWPAPFTDLRYWSLCNYLTAAVENGSEVAFPLVANPLPGGQTDYGCRHDSQVTVGPNGYYTFVVGSEAQRPVIERIPGATFLPFSAADPTTTHLLLLRNMLPSPRFTQAIQDVPEGESSASAAEAMGPYYPRTAICPLVTVVRSGLAACPASTP